MKTKIFLASSSELKEDREKFESLINRKNQQWHDRGVFLDLEEWENFLDALSKSRLQDEYNKAIKECDIFVMLFWTKVGKYTEEEFETAFGQFKATNKPVIYTYFKDAEISTAALSAKQDDLKSLWAFQKKLRELGHYQTMYRNVDQLAFHFYQQLDKLAENGIIKLVDGPQARASAALSTSESTTKVPDSTKRTEVFLGFTKRYDDILVAAHDLDKRVKTQKSPSDEDDAHEIYRKLFSLMYDEIKVYQEKLLSKEVLVDWMTWQMSEYTSGEFKIGGVSYDDGWQWWLTKAKDHEYTPIVKKIFACKDKECVKDVIE
jgi:hypothetical protein